MMTEVQIQKHGSSAIMTPPSDALKIIGEQIGNTLPVNVQAGKLTTINTKKPVHSRYRRAELLADTTPEAQYIERLDGSLMSEIVRIIDPEPEKKVRWRAELALAFHAAVTAVK